MKQPEFIEAKKAEQAKDIADDVRHAEAVALVEKHRDFFEHYAQGKIKIKPAPEGINTFAFNLEENTIYVNSMFFKKLGFSEEKTVFATLHEIEHFMEKIQILSEEGGGRAFDRFLKRIKESKAFSLMDNCVSDIRQNRAVTSKVRGIGELETKIYKEDLFDDTDFTSDPRHIQFSQTILREARVPDEKCQVSPEVRLALDELAKVKGLMDVMTDPETPMSVRLKLQDKYVWPKVEALLKKDLEDKKKEKEKEGEGKGEGEKLEGGKVGKGEKEGEAEEGRPDPDKVFADDYAKAGKKFPEAVPMEEIEKAFKAWKEAERGKETADKADEDYAKKIGVEKKDLQDYRKIVEELEKTINPETNVGVKEELKNLFRRIIAKRLKRVLSPRYPVEEGDELVDPAQLVADVRSGNLQPKVWEDTEIKEKMGDKSGEVEFSFVFDRSSSMKEGTGQKAVEQRKCGVLGMEVLKEFAEMCEGEKINMDKPLEVRSEIYSFKGNETEDRKPLKKMSSELGEAERINVLKKLYDVPGSTTDFNCLQAIADGLDEKDKKKIKSGELKKIVIVFTDGDSDNPTTVQGILERLRGDGVVVIGVGMTKDGQKVLVTYAPMAQVVEDVSKLTMVLGELLKEHLKDL